MFFRFYKQINSYLILKIRCMWSQSRYIKQSKWKPHLNTCLKILHFWKKLWFKFFKNFRKFRGYKLSRTTEKFAKSRKFLPAKLSIFKVRQKNYGPACKNPSKGMSISPSSRKIINSQFFLKRYQWLIHFSTDGSNWSIQGLQYLCVSWFIYNWSTVLLICDYSKE